MIALRLSEYTRALLLATRKFSLCGFKSAQLFLPLALESTSDKAIVRVNSTISSLGAACFITCSLDTKAPLPEHRFAIRFKPFRGGDTGSQLRWLEDRKKSLCNGVIDLNATNIEAIDPAALDNDLAGAVVARRRQPTVVMCPKPTPAMTATGETLQQGTAFSHSAILLVGSWSGVLRDARLIGLVGLPVDEPRMMVRDEHLPVGTGKMPDACAATIKMDGASG